MKLFRRFKALTRPGRPAVRITCLIPQKRSLELRGLIERLGITEMTVQSARRTLLRERRLRLRSGSVFADELVEVVRFHASEAEADFLAAALVDGYGFGDPGKGSLVSQRLSLIGAVAAPPARPASVPRRPPAAGRLNRDLAGLCCIVPRGEGNPIVRVALETGLGAPVITYGRGFGLRAKLGLVRVTIPVEKEIVTLYLNRYDVAEAFRLVSDVMRLDRPGAGFCYWFPVEGGLLDTRIWVGRQPHVASMEQVIAALDVVTGDTAWRRKSERASTRGEAPPVSLLSYTINGTEGDTEPVVRAALAAGASGATLTRVRRERLRGENDAPSAYESSELIIARSALSPVHAAVEAAGLLVQGGFAELADAGAASGYRAP